MTPEASNLNPQMVTLGRLSRGLTQNELATKAGIAQGTVSKIEAGISNPDAQQLSAIADALEYPVDFFETSGAVSGPGLAELYHERRRKTIRTMVLHNAYATTSIRRMHVERLLRSWAEGVVDFPSFPADDFEDPAKSARTIRAHWELPPGPVFNVTQVIEAAGGIVVECDFGSRHIDGFSKWTTPTAPPLFFVNHALPPDRWRWTLAHELGHLVMHAGEMPREGMEREADMFAEEFLMPEAVIKGQLVVPNLPKLTSLKVHWKVSIAALVERAYHLQAISPRQRTTLWQALSRAGYRLREPEDLDPPKELPQALNDLVAFHLRQLGYSASELAAALSLNDAEFQALYLPSQRGLTRIK